MTNQLPSETGSPGETSGALPPASLAKVIASDLRTTNGLLLVLVLCMAGLMPEQFNAICSP